MLIAMMGKASFHRMTGELLGTAMLVFFGVGALLTSGGQGFVGAVALLVTVTVVYWVFRGHFNPWITFALAIRGALDWVTALAIMLAQLIGGVLGAALMWGVFGDRGVASGMGVTRLSEDAGLLKGLLAETVAVFLLVCVVLAVGENDRLGVAMGLAYAAGTLAIFVVTAASMNFARTVGPELVQLIAIRLDGTRVVNWSALTTMWVYLVSGVLGSALAGLVFPSARHTKAPAEEPARVLVGDRV